jgi:hypothetical protein
MDIGEKAIMSKKNEFLTAAEQLKVTNKRYSTQLDVHKREYKDYIMRKINDASYHGWTWCDVDLPCGMPYYYTLKAHLLQWLKDLGYNFKEVSTIDHSRPVWQQVEQISIDWSK